MKETQEKRERKIDEAQTIVWVTSTVPEHSILPLNKNTALTFVFPTQFFTIPLDKHQLMSPIILPNSVEELEAIAQNVVSILQSGADQVVVVPEDKRTIENTLLALQEAQSEAACLQTLCTFPAMVRSATPYSPLICRGFVSKLLCSITHKKLVGPHGQRRPRCSNRGQKVTSESLVIVRPVHK